MVERYCIGILLLAGLEGRTNTLNSFCLSVLDGRQNRGSFPYVTSSKADTLLFTLATTGIYTYVNVIISWFLCIFIRYVESVVIRQ